MNSEFKHPHSAVVDIWLECEGFGKLSVSQVSPTFVVLSEPRMLPPCEGVLVMTIDGKESRERVKLPRGASPEEHFTLISPAGVVISA